MSLYKELIKDISYNLKNTLNEMAKRIDHRTLDRKLWLSVASVCSRNKATECEFVKPMKKLAKDDLINRYVAALIIMKKQCPKNERDMDKIKVFKLFGHRILELGGTINEIQQLYNINMGITSASPKPVINKQPTRKVSEPISTQTISKSRAKRSPINKRYITILDKLIQNIPTSMYDSSDFKLNYVGTYNKPYRACKSDLEKYVNSIIRKSGKNFNKLIDLLRTDIINFNKLIKINNDILFEVRELVGERKRGWDYFDQWLTIDIKNNSYDCFIFNETQSFANDARRRDFKEKFDGNELFKYNLTSCNLFSKKPNIINAFCEGIFTYVVKPYITYKLTADEAGNAENSEETLIKYNMDEEPINYFDWVKDNIKQILKNNPDKQIYVNYSDWSGAIKTLYYDTNLSKFIVQCYLQSGSSDMDKADILSNLIRLSDKNTYRNTYVSDNSYGDQDDYTYTCVVKDLNAFGEKLFNVIKEYIGKGKLI